MSWPVVAVRPEDTAPLRRRVLRGGRDHPPLGDEPGDGSLHLGVYDEGRLVACGSVRPQADRTWRVRGMAVEPAYRGRGAGSDVLAALLDLVGSAGGGTVWCHARTPARGLYERAGFAVEGPQWIDPDIGPHVVMVRPA